MSESLIKESTNMYVFLRTGAPFLSKIILETNKLDRECNDFLETLKKLGIIVVLSDTYMSVYNHENIFVCKLYYSDYTNQIELLS
jgi:hypothetical protein